MTPENNDRRKNDQDRWDKMAAFMARIDERNFHKDLALTVKEEQEEKQDHEGRITSLEHSRTQLKTVGIIASSGFGVWLANKLGIHI